MRQEIVENIQNPDQLEQLFRMNQQAFARSFSEISDEYNTDLVRFWKIRLAQEKLSETVRFVKMDLYVVILLSLFTGLLVKLPAIFPTIDFQSFFDRELSIVVFNGLILYTFWQNKIFDKKNILIYGIAILVLFLYINLLPYQPGDFDKLGDTVKLAFIHSPLLLWCIFGIAHTSFDYKNTSKRIDFIRYNGEFIVMTGLILIAGGILTAMTLGLFSVIKIDILKFYQQNIVLIGLVSAPIVSSYLLRLYPDITSKIAPVIARVFTPLVLISLVVYLISMVFSEAKIQEDRNLLLIFNIMLIAVMALIVFSIAELDRNSKRDLNVFVLFLLAVLAIVVNAIALFAIISRLSAGFTPNRTVVIGSNVLIFVNLILIAKCLYLAYFKAASLETVENMVAKYLTVYLGWTIFVIFILPLVFGFK
ncbi:MAG TPA: DUF4153 domain-containing protein [Prolixibacteraceae bacterium]